MAEFEVKFHEDRFAIISQVFCCDIHDTWENRKVWFVILRSLCCPRTGKPFFSYQRIAEEFGYNARQNINNYVREYEQCDENLFDYLRHKRKVDPVVVEAVRQELGQDVLAKTGALRLCVNQRLERDDLTSANIRVTLEQIPCTVIRRNVVGELAAGALHVKEAVVLGELFAFFEHAEVSQKRGAVESCCPRALPAQSLGIAAVDGDAAARGGEVCDAESEKSVASHEVGGHCEKLVRYAESVSAAGIEAIREEPDAVGIQKTQAEAVGTRPCAVRGVRGGRTHGEGDDDVSFRRVLIADRAVVWWVCQKSDLHLDYGGKLCVVAGDSGLGLVASEGEADPD